MRTLKSHLPKCLRQLQSISRALLQKPAVSVKTLAVFRLLSVSKQIPEALTYRAFNTIFSLIWIIREQSRSDYDFILSLSITPPSVSLWADPPLHHRHLSPSQELQFFSTQLPPFICFVWSRCSCSDHSSHVSRRSTWRANTWHVRRSKDRIDPVSWICLLQFISYIHKVSSVKVYTNMIGKSLGARATPSVFFQDSFSVILTDETYSQTGLLGWVMLEVCCHRHAH